MAHSPLLLQLIVILGCARILGLILRLFGQPMVVGEMVAGLVLGPAVFGSVAPTLQAALFQRSSLPELDAISQLGLVLFMFIVGAELRLPSGAKAQIVAASWIGVLSVLLPMALGFAVAVPLRPLLAPPGITFWPFALFIAAAMSITAFPVMARILKDRAVVLRGAGRLSLSGAVSPTSSPGLALAVVVVLVGSASDWSRIGKMLTGLTVLCALLFGVLRP